MKYHVINNQNLNEDIKNKRSTAFQHACKLKHRRSSGIWTGWAHSFSLLPHPPPTTPTLHVKSKLFFSFQVGQRVFNLRKLTLFIFPLILPDLVSASSILCFYLFSFSFDNTLGLASSIQSPYLKLCSVLGLQMAIIIPGVKKCFQKPCVLLVLCQWLFIHFVALLFKLLLHPHLWAFHLTSATPPCQIQVIYQIDNIRLAGFRVHNPMGVIWM